MAAVAQLLRAMQSTTMMIIAVAKPLRDKRSTTNQRPRAEAEKVEKVLGKDDGTTHPKDAKEEKGKGKGNGKNKAAKALTDKDDIMSGEEKRRSTPRTTWPEKIISKHDGKYICLWTHCGECRRGADCIFSHDKSLSLTEKQNVDCRKQLIWMARARSNSREKTKDIKCRYFAEGTCRSGATCRFSHD